MTENLYPHEFSLPATDLEGRELKVRDQAEVLTIPRWFLEGLAEEARAIL